MSDLAIRVARLSNGPVVRGPVVSGPFMTGIINR